VALLWLALAAAVCNLGYVLATLQRRSGARPAALLPGALVDRPVLSRLLLDERLSGSGAWSSRCRCSGQRPCSGSRRLGLPAPQDLADWLGLLAGFAFALFNVSPGARGASVRRPR
jgi:hypothetical protein